MEKIFNKEEKGITLVALAVTIVVLVLIAGVNINLVLGDNGIVKKAQEAREKTEEAKANEENDFAGWNDSIDKILDDSDNDANKMAKYFTYTVNEDTKEATVTGVNEEYVEYEYYQGNQNYGARVKAIIDEGERITDIVIPREIEQNGKKYIVTKIGEDILSNGGYRKEDLFHGEITGLIMPDTITEIGNNAFYGQPIEKIVFSNNLREIGIEAFYNNKLTNIQLPKSLISIGSRAFDRYERIASTVKIPKSVSVIGKGAFCSGDTIYCEIDKKPDGWDSYWHGYATVYWSQTL